MSETARQRAAARRRARAYRTRTTEKAPQKAPQPPTDYAPDYDPAEEPDPERVDDEPAVPTVSPNRRTLEVSLRPRDWNFLDAMAEAEQLPVEKIVERLVREAKRKYTVPTGSTVHREDFDPTQGI